MKHLLLYVGDSYSFIGVCLVGRNPKPVFPTRPLALTVITAVILFPSFLQAQNGGFAGAGNRMGFSARGMAMSNAMAAVTSEGHFAYYNPAQTALYSEYRQSDFTAGVLSFDRVFQTAGVQFQLPPSAGLSFNIMRTGVKNIDGRTQSGYPTGLFDVSDYQFRSSFGIRMSEKLNAGIGINFNIANYHEQLDNAVSTGFDVGFLYHLHPNVNLAASVKDLFAGYTWNSKELYELEQAQNVVNNFPVRLMFAGAYQREDFTLSLDYEIQIYSSETARRSMIIQNGIPVQVTETEQISTSASQLRAGGSWKAHERFTLRGGLQFPDLSYFQSWGFSSGFSLHLPFDVFSPSIDYAFVMEPSRVSNMHIFSLRLNL